MVITWSLLETGQWDDALEYAGHARTLAAIYHEPVVHTSVITAAAYIAACRGHSAAATEDAMSVLGIPGLTARSSMTARANHAMGMAALVQDRKTKHSTGCASSPRTTGVRRTIARPCSD
ncbi:MAG TPA: hypothetical protein VHZ03_40710 [Trebonia sp.]|jgi:hypothetical protein|nr:hypothetical protein [Trebonia sp.]